MTTVVGKFEEFESEGVGVHSRPVAACPHQPEAFAVAAAVGVVGTERREVPSADHFLFLEEPICPSWDLKVFDLHLTGKQNINQFV